MSKENMNKKIVQFLNSLYVILLRNMLLWKRFKLSSAVKLVSIFATIITFFFIAKLVDSGNTEISSYRNTGYFTFVLIGLAFNHYIAISVGNHLTTLKKAYFSNWLELIISSKAKLKTFLFGNALWGYIFATMNIILYFVVGTLFFEAKLSLTSNWSLVFLILLLSIASVSGLGLISASLFFLANAREGIEPLSWAVMVSSGFLTGVFYPISILPGWLQTISKLLPQTYALKSIRLILQSNAGLENPYIQMTLLILVAFCIIFLPIGTAMLRVSIKKAEKEGSLARWN